MKRLHDYLDCERIRVILPDKEPIEGFPIDVTYADEEENPYAEDIINLETDSGKIWGIREGRIKEIIVIKE